MRAGNRRHQRRLRQYLPADATTHIDAGCLVGGMRYSIPPTAVWITTAALCLGAATGWLSAAPRVRRYEIAVPAMAGSAAAFGVIRADSVDDAASATSDQDPFRLTREPPAVPYEPDHELAAPQPQPQTMPHPHLTLSGIVGPPWVAVLEGVPGRTGSVVARVGDTIGRPPLAFLVLHRIEHDTVIVRGLDTTWTLGVSRPWR